MSAAFALLRNGRGRLASLACSVALLSVVFSLAQTTQLKRNFHASRSQIEQELRALKAYSGGKLPVLEGFVESQESLDAYQRGYYQYSIHVTSTSANESVVQANAKITAWYSDKDNSRSGYRVLPSNGRLEADLFDRLEQALSQVAGSPAAAKSTGENPSPAVSLPETPSAVANSSSVFSSSKSSSAALPAGEQAATDRRIQQLAQRAQNLEEIIHNQSHPDNLVSVKTSQTPVLAKPVQGAQVLFQADAEDEFQLVDTTGSWVHVQISGISRGWIERSKVSLPGETPGKNARDLATPASPEKTLATTSFHATREETGMFPGNWPELRGKSVRIIWVQAPPNDGSNEETRLDFARSLFRKKFPELSRAATPLAGLVIVFDSEDGGMAAATMATLQQWSAGHLSDSAFWRQCWFDPPDAFKVQN